MRKQINKEYLISLNFVLLTEHGKECLKKDYPAVQLFNDKSEAVDLVDISVYLENQDNKWINSKCLSNDNKHTDLFNTHFKSNEIKELLYFDMAHSI